MEIRELAISNCDRAPIHIPGYIQTFGALIATDRNLEVVTHASSNVEDLLGIPALEALGKPLSPLLSEQVTHQIRNVAGHPTIESQRERVGTYQLHNQSLDISLHRSGSHFLIELESVSSTDNQNQTALTQVRLLLARLQDQTESSELLEMAVKDLQRVTGFDRVMAYQFFPDGAGEVVAEAVVEGHDPYLGLRFPSLDTPQRVRTIALQMPIRVIANIQAPSSELIADGSNGAPLDLSLTHVRGVHPIHLEYLANMRVQSTMILAIIVRRELWGLFAFHHSSPKLLSPNYRATCDLFGQLFSLKFQQVLEEERFNTRKRTTSAINYAIQQLTNSGNFVQTIKALGEQLCTMLTANGLAVISNKEIETYGEVPALELIEELIHQIQNTPNFNLVCFDNLSQLNLSNPALLGKTAGALCLGISSSDQVFVIFFRNQIIYDVRWAGPPAEVNVVEGPNGPRLHPRASFAEYRESVTNQCQPWSVLETEAALELRTGLMQLAIRQGEVQQQEWQRQQRQQDLLIAELNHRVKNILALIRSISRQTRQSTTSIEEYTLLLDRRIAALAYAHDLVAGNGLEWPSLHNLLTAELRPYLAETERQVKISGMEVGLKANFVPMFALVIHELITNSAKYGALSTPTGKVDIRWMEQDGGLAFYWRESNGPAVFPPKRRGFGRTLIERAIPFEFEGEATIRFPSSGVQVDFWLPTQLILFQTTSPDASITEAPPPQEAEDSALTTGRVLIVEDNMLLAIEMENMLESLGYTLVDTAPRVKQALKLLSQEDYILGILDINLKEENSFVVARQLLRQEIPFLFTTGYDSKFTIPDELGDVVMLKKPVDEDQLQTTLQQLLG